MRRYALYRVPILVSILCFVGRTFECVCVCLCVCVRVCAYVCVCLESHVKRNKKCLVNFLGSIHAHTVLVHLDCGRPYRGFFASSEWTWPYLDCRGDAVSTLVYIHCGET